MNTGPYRILVEERAQKFLLDLDPKRFKQVASRIFRLSQDPRPAEHNVGA